jgi:hypothetical protein
MLIGAIQDFDEISGTLTFTSSFIFFWNDEIRRWDPALPKLDIFHILKTVLVLLGILETRS